MNKAVMLSIQPKWCELIASGKKTIEVRKTRPSIETPFKCYIYCTQHKYHHLYDLRKVNNGELSLSVVEHNKTSLVADGFLNGKVIGEFVCDRIEKIKPRFATFVIPTPYDFEDTKECFDVYDIDEETLAKTCLTEEELCDYGKGATLYGWHISDLVIYDKPRELWEFKHEIGRDENVIAFDKIRRPPQSWMYVEDEIC